MLNEALNKSLEELRDVTKENFSHKLSNLLELERKIEHKERERYSDAVLADLIYQFEDPNKSFTSEQINTMHKEVNQLNDSIINAPPLSLDELQQRIISKMDRRQKLWLDRAYRTYGSIVGPNIVINTQTAFSNTNGSMTNDLSSQAITIAASTIAALASGGIIRQAATRIGIPLAKIGKKIKKDQTSQSNLLNTDTPKKSETPSKNSFKEIIKSEFSNNDIHKIATERAVEVDFRKRAAKVTLEKADKYITENNIDVFSSTAKEIKTTAQQLSETIINAPLPNALELLKINDEKEKQRKKIWGERGYRIYGAALGGLAIAGATASIATGAVVGAWPVAAVIGGAVVGGTALSFVSGAAFKKAGLKGVKVEKAAKRIHKLRQERKPKPRASNKNIKSKFYKDIETPSKNTSRKFLTELKTAIREEFGKNDLSRVLSLENRQQKNSKEIAIQYLNEVDKKIDSLDISSLEKNKMKDAAKVKAIEMLKSPAAHQVLKNSIQKMKHQKLNQYFLHQLGYGPAAGSAVGAILTQTALASTPVVGQIAAAAAAATVVGLGAAEVFRNVSENIYIPAKKVTKRMATVVKEEKKGNPKQKNAAKNTANENEIFISKKIEELKQPNQFLQSLKDDLKQLNEGKQIKEATNPTLEFEKSNIEKKAAYKKLQSESLFDTVVMHELLKKEIKTTKNTKEVFKASITGFKKSLLEFSNKPENNIKLEFDNEIQNRKDLINAISDQFNSKVSKLTIGVDNSKYESLKKTHEASIKEVLQQPFPSREELFARNKDRKSRRWKHSRQVAYWKLGFPIGGASASIINTASNIPGYATPVIGIPISFIASEIIEKTGKNIVIPSKKVFTKTLHSSIEAQKNKTQKRNGLNLAQLIQESSIELKNQQTKLPTSSNLNTNLEVTPTTIPTASTGNNLNESLQNISKEFKKAVKEEFSSKLEHKIAIERGKIAKEKQQLVEGIQKYTDIQTKELDSILSASEIQTLKSTANAEIKKVTDSKPLDIPELFEKQLERRVDRQEFWLDAGIGIQGAVTAGQIVNNSYGPVESGRDIAATNTLSIPAGLLLGSAERTLATKVFIPLGKTTKRVQEVIKDEVKRSTTESKKPSSSIDPTLLNATPTKHLKKDTSKQNDLSSSKRPSTIISNKLNINKKKRQTKLKINSPS